MLKGKNILIGITGGIAAYKICELIRMFKYVNANVKVVCTPNALHFVTKTTLQSLTQNEVATIEFEIENFKPEHISYADEADIMIIAPATANTISKMASGICDNLLTSIICAFKKPVMIAPAMNTGMWENKIIQKNIEILKDMGYLIMEPEDGFLACGISGKGRLCELDKIYDKACEVLTGTKIASKGKIVITSGGTMEDIDPVRYLSNYSSGKMGEALADEASNRGYETVLISTKDVKKPYNVLKVKSAIDMQQAVEKEFNNAICVIMAAAVADYRAKEIQEQKIKKTSEDTLTLELVKNPDILKELSHKKTTQTVVGFCAESENLINNAQEKLKTKGCDFLVANDISRSDIGFGSDYNEVTVFSNIGDNIHIERATKKEIASKILDIVLNDK